jgi:soluble lytic murein transglycosylase-like protein
MLLASAALVAPSAVKPPLAGPSLLAPEAITRTVTPPKGIVSTSETFRLPPESAFEGLIHEAAKRFRLAPALIRAVIRAESGFDPDAVSRAGAEGLMQLMPALAAEMGVANAFDPRENIMAGTQYLSALIAEQNGNVALALASYNAGPGAVERYGGIPPFKETQRYVKTILDHIARSELGDQ